MSWVGTGVYQFHTMTLRSLKKLKTWQRKEIVSLSLNTFVELFGMIFVHLRKSWLIHETKNTNRTGAIKKWIR